ncbi:Endoglucanase-1 [Fusarium oxysporum f. sp. albedinis]|nr:Endoglucanase-1 [Fusarium oxysporum f. sp. albedinis]
MDQDSLEHGRNWSGRPAFAFRRIGAWDRTATRDQGLDTRIPRYHHWAFPADRIGIEEFVYLIHHRGNWRLKSFFMVILVRLGNGIRHT